jgi:anti-anti-sigma regulatory factor
LAVLAAAHQEGAVPLALVSSRHAVVRALEITGLDRVLHVFPSLADALTST